jgi:uncharacterized membrane protein
MKNFDDLASKWFPGKGPGTTEAHVLRQAAERRPIARDINESADRARSYGDRLADAIARVGGSWGFILAFLAFLAIWTLGNAWLLSTDPFDPYPFIFLNLILSMLAALQAPIIMMSQNRQAARDRLDAAHDYEVNLRAEIEIMALHEKMDALRHKEIVAMHDEVREIASRVSRIETAVTAAGKGA